MDSEPPGVQDPFAGILGTDGTIRNTDRLQELLRESTESAERQAAIVAYFDAHAPELMEKVRQGIAVPQLREAPGYVFPELQRTLLQIQNAMQNAGKA